MQNTADRKCKPPLFSIAAILGMSTNEGKHPPSTKTDSKERAFNYGETGKANEESKVSTYKTKKNDSTCKNPEYSWLNCSRYNPPRVQRAKRRRRMTSNASRQSRIPFSQVQRETLENYYKANRYLSSGTVQELSHVLNLPEQRIKIWFQNRRARERRQNTQGTALLG